MGSKLNLTFLDFDPKEKGSMSFEGLSLSAANYDAQVALHEALITAVQALTTMPIHKRQTVASEAILTSTRPTDPYAQREIKWLVRFHDNVTGQPLTVTVPGADLSLLDAGSEVLDLTGTEAAAFKTAFEAYVKAGEGSDNAVVVDQILFVGRNT